MNTYFPLGITHILDFQGYDHMLFVALLVCGVKLTHWRSLLWIISAFTLGHSLSLLWSVTQGSPLDRELIELLIPLTILITGLQNVLFPRGHLKWSIVLTTFFGLIHGLGFAGYIVQLLPDKGNIWKPLLFFNLGVEFGQIIAAGTLLALLWSLRFITENAVHIAQKAISVVGIGISLLLAIINWPYS